MDKKWYLVYTKPSSEKKVAEILKKRKVESYSPVNNFSDSDNNKKLKDIALFKNYVFIKTTEAQHKDIKKINGVINLVYWMGKPVTVKNAEIKVIKLFLNDYENITIEKVKVDDSIIDNNHKSGLEAPMITIKSKKAYVTLASLGYIMTAEVEIPNVRIISVEGSSNTSDLKQNRLLNKVF